MEEQAAGKQRVLVVEDRRDLLVAVERILEKESYTVQIAGDGLEALQIMEEARPDLIVADIMMPRMDGYALYEAVRARADWVPIPFIFLTAKAAAEDVLKGKEMGAEDYLTKPLNRQQLVVAVRSRLRRAQAIRASTEAEFDRLKRQIVTVLGHELRTPLTYITGYTEMALEDAPSLSPGEFEQFLWGIKRGADRLTRLVQEMLVLIQLDMGQAEKDYRVLARVRRDLGAVVEETTSEYAAQAVKAGVSLETRLPEDLPAVRLCEPFFANALGRLVDNGIKFSRGEGKHVTVSSQAVEGWVEVAVADEGVGIAPSEIPHLFERFRQIDRERMEQQGVGLGLAIAQQLIRLHGGEIRVESEVGQGSAFTIRLPVAEEGYHDV